MRVTNDECPSRLEVCTDAKVELAAGEVVGNGVAVVVDVGDPVVGAGVVDVE